MTLKQSYFSFLFLILLSACKSTDSGILFEKTHGSPKHPRGLFVFNDSLWAISGYDGVFQIFNGFESSLIDSIPGLEDLRDVEILPDRSIVLMNSGNKGQIWRYFPQNDSLAKVFDRDSVFLDGMSFWNNQVGIAFGDPVNGRMTILRTMDSSNTWQSLDYNLVPVALDKEAGFAASGTGIATIGAQKVIIGTGGAKIARLYISEDQGLNWQTKDTPMKTGGSYGIYSMYFWNEMEGLIIGGSYLYPDDKDSICFYTADGGETWSDRSKGLGGYSSGIHGNEDGSIIVATGRKGVYYTLNKGEEWGLLTDEKFYSVRVTEKRVYFSGNEGRVQVIDNQCLKDLD